MKRLIFRPFEEIYSEAEEGRRFDIAYFAMLVFGCLIALLGLLLNSPAVIIGAMLISPLMGPLLGCGLALSLADWHVGSKSARNLALSVAETVLIAALATWLSPLRELTPEIVARTNPNLMDLLIAVFSGCAGTLAFASRRGAVTILPGVAIATAVMPPLAAVGYGVSTRQWPIAGGAGMLFLTNLTAIVLSSAVVFLAIGLRPRKNFAQRESGVIRYRMPIAAAILVVLAIPLFRTLKIAAYQAQMRGKIEKSLAHILRQNNHARPDSISVSFEGDTPVVKAVIATPEYIDLDAIKQTNVALSQQIGRAADLEVQQVQLATKRQKPPTDYVAGGMIKPVATVEDPGAELSRVQAHVSDTLCSLLGPTGPDNCTVESVGSSKVLEIHLRLIRNEFLPHEALLVAANSLQVSFKRPVHLQATVLLPETAIPLTKRPRSSRLSQTTEKALLKLKPLLGNQSVRIRLESPAEVPMNEIKANKQAITKLLRLDPDVVKAQPGSDAWSVELAQELEAESDKR